jgi:hypothetical protein
VVGDFKSLFSSSPHKDSFNFEIGFFSINTEGSVTVFSEVFKSL